MGSKVFLTVDLGFGDAGKGGIVDFLTRQYEAHTVVRYNGGAQAAHRVVSAEGTHVFSQFGSGTLAGAATHLSRFMLLDPLAMMAEERHLHQLGIDNAFGRTTIDARALIITPFQRAINRLRELARPHRHGSCGLGIGETMSDFLEHRQQVLFAEDLLDPDRFQMKWKFLRELNHAKWRTLPLPKTEEVAREEAIFADKVWEEEVSAEFLAFAQLTQIVPSTYLGQLLQQSGTIVFEAAQGVLLDEWYGFHPHTTWSTTTLANADHLLRVCGYGGDVTRIGIIRAYGTRHGAGPFVTEDPVLTQLLPDEANRYDAWQTAFRVGWLDLVLLRYALEIVGHLDYLAVTCLDRVIGLPELFVCEAYQSADDATPITRLPVSPQPRDLVYQEQLTRLLEQVRPILTAIPNNQALLQHISTSLGVRIGIESWGESAESKRFVLA